MKSEGPVATDSVALFRHLLQPGFAEDPKQGSISVLLASFQQLGVVFRSADNKDQNVEGHILGSPVYRQPLSYLGFVSQLGGGTAGSRRVGRSMIRTTTPSETLLPASQTEHPRLAATWTPKVCKRMAGWAAFKRFGLLLYTFLGVQVWDVQDQHFIYLQPWPPTIPQSKTQRLLCSPFLGSISSSLIGKCVKTKKRLHRSLQVHHTRHGFLNPNSTMVR